MQELNLDVAGEFLVMAATLIHIKSQMLLPRAGSRRRTTSRRGGSARGAGAAPARAPEVQGRRRAAARAGDAAQRAVACVPTRASRRLPATSYEPELEVDLFSLLAAFRACSSAPSSGRRWCCRPNEMSIEDAHRAAAGAAVGDRGVRLRGSVRRRRRLARRS